SRLTHERPVFTQEAPKPEEKHEEATGDEVILFASKTCPNCKAAAMLLDKAGVKYRKIYAEDEPQLAVQYGVKQAPTLITVKNGEAERHVNLSNIRKYIGV
ncbi:MAG: thioredoxin family protein, partial [Clostridia bacterium]|nr:thioredoxin family protein [Clostridia bacterium]